MTKRKFHPGVFMGKLPRGKKDFIERNRESIYREHREFINQFVKDWVKHHG